MAGVVGGTAPVHRADRAVSPRWSSSRGTARRASTTPRRPPTTAGPAAAPAAVPNARAFAQMANDPRVRRLLAEEGLPIPDDVLFVGAYHNTCDDGLTYYDLDRLPASHREVFERARTASEEARRRNAHERCRRFESAGLPLTPDEALRHVEGRAEDLSQTRPEYGHATNAICIVGRRSRTRGLFLDRRAFLTSYDADPGRRRGLDPGGPAAGRHPRLRRASTSSITSRPSIPPGTAAGPSCPTTSRRCWASWTGPPATCGPGSPGRWSRSTSRCGSCSSSRPPRRSLSAIMAREESIGRLVRNGWVQLATLDPRTADAPRLPGRRLRALRPKADDLPVASVLPGVVPGLAGPPGVRLHRPRRRRPWPGRGGGPPMNIEPLFTAARHRRHRGTGAAAGRPGARLPAWPAAERGRDGPLDRLVRHRRAPRGPGDPRPDARHSGSRSVPVELGDWVAIPAGALPLPPEVRLRPALGPLRAPHVRPRRDDRRLRQPLPAPRAGIRPVLPAPSPSSCSGWSSPRWPGRSRPCSSAGSWSGSRRPCSWPSSTSGRRRSSTRQRVWSVYRISDAAFLLAAVALHHVSGAGDFAGLMGDRAVAGGARRPSPPGRPWAWGPAARRRRREVGPHPVLGLAAAGDGGARRRRAPSSTGRSRCTWAPSCCSASARSSSSRPGSSAAVVALGLGSAVFAAIAGRVQADAKGALAFASLTQVGIITAEIGAGPAVHPAGPHHRPRLPADAPAPPGAVAAPRLSHARRRRRRPPPPRAWAGGESAPRGAPPTPLPGGLRSGPVRRGARSVRRPALRARLPAGATGWNAAGPTS